MMARNRRQPGHWIPWLFVGGFLITFAANGVMIAFALSTWSGLRTENPYERGLAYNATLAAARAQQRLGWHHDVSVEPTAPKSARLALSLTDADARPIYADIVTAKLVRPTHEGWDFDAVLTSRGAGRYSTTVDFPLPGQWELRLEARRGTDRYQIRRRIVID